jgi:hypothetical protein
MNFQNKEFIETDKFQYLLIHKNGSSSVREIIEKNKHIINSVWCPHKIRWTVIRDPYERFMSGLSYDLKRHKVKLEDINISELFNGVVNINTRMNGNTNHCISQASYLINANIQWYVDIEDLNLFLNMHFDENKIINKNEEKIELNLDKKEIMKYLNFDYFIYDQIKSSNNLWKWNLGKIF